MKKYKILNYAKEKNITISSNEIKTTLLNITHYHDLYVVIFPTDSSADIKYLKLYDIADVGRTFLFFGKYMIPNNMLTSAVIVSLDSILTGRVIFAIDEIQ